MLNNGNLRVNSASFDCLMMINTGNLRVNNGSSSE